jgi:hypothetical protein
LIDISREPARDASIRMTALMALGDIANELRHTQAGQRAARAAHEVANAALTTYPSEAADPHNTAEKILLRAGVYAIARLRTEADTSIPLLQDIAGRGAAFFGEPATAGLAQWGIDRFNIRAFADDPSSARRAELQRSLEHQGSDILSGRRLVDPLKSLALIESASAQRTSATRPRRVQSKHT